MGGKTRRLPIIFIPLKISQQLANFDLELLQDTNITDGVYAQDFKEFRIVVSDAPRRHRRMV